MIENWSIVLGGGIGCRYGSNPIINNNTILGNRAGSGGGIGCLGGIPLISNNIISSNRARMGGGIHCSNVNSMNVINNTITNNITFDDPGQGGGIFCGGSNVSIKNTILWADSASSGNEIVCVDGSLTVSYSNIESGWPGTGNIDIDPLFRDPGNGDFHLMSIACGDSLDSPCIDAGHPDSFDVVLGCFNGLGGTRSDMGAYGGNNGDYQTDVEFDDMVLLPESVFELKNYPNPFNAVTTITFALPIESHTNLTIYDLLGRRVENPVDQVLPAGFHRIQWDASNSTSGIYFYRIEACDMVAKRKIVLLK
jgi:hypothetical protein